VHFVHDVEPHGGVPSQQAGQARGKAGTHHDREPTLNRFGIEVEQGADLVHIVVVRHQRCAGTECRPGGAPVSVSRQAQHDHIGAGYSSGPIGDHLGALGALTQRRPQSVRSGLHHIDQHQI
jgi:hypothetical protein